MRPRLECPSSRRTRRHENASPGPRGLSVSELGFGCMGMSFGYGPTTLGPQEQIDVIRTAHARGVTFSTRLKPMALSQRRTGRRSHRPIPRRCRRCDQVRVRHQGPPTRWAEQPPGTNQESGRCLPEAP